MKRLSKSQPFLNEIWLFKKNSLEVEYRKEIKRKIHLILNRWDFWCEKSNKKISKNLDSVKKYILENKQCKLPWTLKEYKTGFKKFEEKLFKFAKQEKSQYISESLFS